MGSNFYSNTFKKTVVKLILQLFFYRYNIFINQLLFLLHFIDSIKLLPKEIDYFLLASLSYINKKIDFF
jgi:hypothetical protein